MLDDNQNAYEFAKESLLLFDKDTYNYNEFAIYTLIKNYRLQGTITNLDLIHKALDTIFYSRHNKAKYFYESASIMAEIGEAYLINKDVIIDDDINQNNVLFLNMINGNYKDFIDYYSLKEKPFKEKKGSIFEIISEDYATDFPLIIKSIYGKYYCLALKSIDDGIIVLENMIDNKNIRSKVEKSYNFKLEIIGNKKYLKLI